jgi:Asp-tRNA(Asn)/Glu-tRNA(Gln) amidotransferase A subunit family amidase
LAELFLDRLERIGPRYNAVVTVTRSLALAQAERADRELKQGLDRGPLHGIPYGAKDLLAARGAPTTWGAGPFAEQVFDQDAAVVERLEQAGAVLIAKLSLGELGWGDVWFGGRTNNPWDPRQGSSGSSAGPAAATAAGGVAFSIGSETYGSIVSPSAVCGCSSLRPTFGTVSRRGAMALAWTMDKLGPICRSMTDAAIVMEVIAGPDALDDQCLDRPFHDLGPVDVAGLRAGFPADSFTTAEGRAFLESLRALGVELVAVPLPELPVDELILILTVEAAAAFDQLTTSGRDAELVRQVRYAWPNAMREARLIPAVEYIKANRIRRLLAAEWQALFAEIEVLVHESQHPVVLAATNLTGHPTAVVPTALVEGLPGSVSFTGALFDDARLVAIADAWQRATGHHFEHPEVGHGGASGD